MGEDHSGGEAKEKDFGRGKAEVATMSLDLVQSLSDVPNDWSRTL